MAALSSHRRLALAAGAGAIALLILLIALVMSPARALLAYLAAYVTVATTAIGALVLLLIGYVTNARWLAPLRRLQESLASVFPLLAVLFLPLAIGVRHLYVWATPSAPRHHAWFSPAGFIVRGFLYLAVFIITTEVLRRWSLRRDTVPGGVPDGDPEAALRRERVFAAAMLPPVALATTFAAIDWVMSLEPTWVSSMFPVYAFAAGFSASIAVLAIAAAVLRAPLGLTGNHFHALGRMVFAFVVFWAYTSYFQGFLIQIANRPAEVTFFIVRTHGVWWIALWTVALLRFALPFLLLLPRGLKARPRYVATVSALVVLGHVVEMMWLVLPSAGATPSWIDLIAFVGIGGACVAFAIWRLNRAPLTVAGDPFLAAGLRYESPT
ncbi:MAG: hypothetical protein SFX73_36110 [Kofleriaceae bacterium]|nr:hypothetical protein [Kofleriaceae bacterium]